MRTKTILTLAAITLFGIVGLKAQEGSDVSAAKPAAAAPAATPTPEAAIDGSPEAAAILQQAPLDLAPFSVARLAKS